MRLALDKQTEYARELVTRIGPRLGELGPALLAADQSTDAGIEAQRARVEQLKAVLATMSTPEARELRERRRYAGQADRLDRRRRRLGLRHRLRRPRPRARVRAQGERAGAGHRGVLQHGRADVQGHAARRGREVRRRRQVHREEGPRSHGDDATATSTWRAWPWAAATPRRSRRSTRRKRTRDRRSSSPTATASPTATISGTAWTSRRRPSSPATGRSSATIPGFAARAGIPCSSTPRRRASTSRSTPTTRRATPCSPTAIPRPRSALLEEAREDVLTRWRVYEQWATVPPRRLDAGGPAMSDLSTSYLGLTLTSPLVASAGPLSESLDNIRRMEDAGAGAVVLSLALRGADRAREPPSRSSSLSRDRELRRVADLSAGRARLQARTRRLPRARPTSQGRREHSRHRQPQRRVHRRLDQLRQEDPGGRGRRARAERLLHPHRPCAHLGRGRADVRRPRPRRDAGASASRWRSSSGTSGAPSPTWRRGSTERAPAGSCCSTASTSPTSTWTTSRWCRASRCPARTSCSCGCTGRPFSTAACRRTLR